MGQNFPLVEWLSSKREVLKKLFGCDLCFGFWIYLVLAFFIKQDIGIRFIVVREVCIAAVSAFVMHLISLGWKEKFSVIVIGDK